MKNNNWEKEFNKDYCNSYAGDSGLGGNDPQDPVDEWACYPNDVRKFIRSLLTQQKQELLAEVRGIVGEDEPPIIFEHRMGINGQDQLNELLNEAKIRTNFRKELRTKLDELEESI